MGENGKSSAFCKGNGTQPTQHGKLWGPATHSPKYETHILGPEWKPFFWPPSLVPCRLQIILGLHIMSQSIPTGYIPPGQSPGKFFWASKSRPPGQNFLSNSLPRGKKWWSNSRGWGKIFPNSKKLLLKLAKKSLKNWENYETVQLFYLENLKNLYVLDWSRTTRKSLNTPALISN